MPKGPDMPVYRFVVHTPLLDGTTHLDSVTAAYFQEAGEYTVFKDAEHSVVDAFKTDAVLRIKRADGPVELV